jgi:hypothetical protein
VSDSCHRRHPFCQPRAYVRGHPLPRSIFYAAAAIDVAWGCRAKPGSCTPRALLRHDLAPVGSPPTSPTEGAARHRRVAPLVLFSGERQRRGQRPRRWAREGKAIGGGLNDNQEIPPCSCASSPSTSSCFASPPSLVAGVAPSHTRLPRPRSIACLGSNLRPARVI